MNRMDAVMEAMNYCVLYEHDFKVMELTYNEFYDLLSERDDRGMVAMGVKSSSRVQLFGVDIRAERRPRSSVMRRKYLMFVDSCPWISELHDKIEGAWS